MTSESLPTGVPLSFAIELASEAPPMRRSKSAFMSWAR